MTTAPERIEFFVTCAPGAEPWLARELRALGILPGAVVPGGVEAKGFAAHLVRVCLGSSLAMRVLVRIAHFNAAHFAELERHAKAVDWSRWISASPVDVRVHCKQSRLYHSDAVRERVLGAIAGAVPNAADSGSEPKSRVQVRIVRDRCTLSVDASGEALHRRGWKAEVAKAPLREDLASLLLTVSGWTPGAMLVDPFAGSGTIVIEAARRAAGLPPGGQRAFAFERAPWFRTEFLDEARSRLARDPTDGPVLLGFDRDAGAVEAATHNAARAGVSERVRFEQAAVGSLAEGRVWQTPVRFVVTNPPYGARVGKAKGLPGLYRALGVFVQSAGAELGLVCADAALARATKLPVAEQLTTDHGGTRVGMWRTQEGGDLERRASR